MELSVTQAGSVRWRVEPDWLEPLRAGLLDSVTHLDVHPGARLVKRSIVRTVYRVALPGQADLIVKVYHVHRWRRRLKALVVGPTPVREWRISRRLVATGMPVSHAVAVGVPTRHSPDLEGYLIVEAAGGARGFNETLAELGAGDSWEPGAEALVEKLARLVRGLHEQGVSHRDLHCGNVLVRAEAPDPECPFVVVDLHRMRLGRTPGPRQRASCIALLLRTCVLWRCERERLVERFLEVYLHDAGAAERRLLTPVAIVREAERQRRRRLRSRARRCLRNSSRFAVEETEGWRVYHRRDYPVAELLRLLDERPAPAERETGKPIRVSRATRPAGGAVVEVREFRESRLARVAPRWLWRPRGLVEYAAAHERTVRTGRGPLAVAALVGVRGARRGRSAAVLELEQVP